MLHAHGQGNFGALLKSTAKKKTDPLFKSVRTSLDDLEVVSWPASSE